MNALILEKKIQKPLKLHIIKDSLVEIGSILKDARLRRLLNVKDIREKTCIPTHHILAIESGIREELPEDFFLISFIRKYAKAVGLNEQAICEKYLSSKARNLNDEKETFDLLFQKKNEEPASNFLQVYHFYFFIGLCLFAIACYLMIQFNINTSDENKVTSENFVKTMSEDSMPVPEVGFSNRSRDIARYVPKATKKQVVQKQKTVSKKTVSISKPKQIVQAKTPSRYVARYVPLSKDIALMLRPPVRIGN